MAQPCFGSLNGYEDFNEASDVLEMLKGGFGLFAAPGLTKLSMIIGLCRPRLVPDYMYVKHMASLRLWCLPTWTTSSPQATLSNYVGYVCCLRDDSAMLT